MARKEDAGLVEKHLEKIVLAVAAVILVVAVVRWGLASPRRVELAIDARGVALPQKEYLPDQVDPAIKTASDKLENWLEDKDPDEKSIPDYAGILEKIYKNPYDERYVHPCINFRMGRVPPARGKKTGSTVELAKLADLMPLLKPEKPLVKACREVQVIPSPDADGEVKHNEVDVHHIVGVFEFGKVLEKWKEALKKTYVPAKIVYVALETQRRYRLPDGSWSQPEPVSMVVMSGAPTLPTIPTPDGKNLLEIQQKTRELAWITNQEYILEPPYYDIVWPNRQTGTWRLRNHKARTRVSDLLKKDEEKPSGAGRGMEREFGERAREGGERGTIDRRAAERRVAERRAAEQRAAERRAAEQRAAAKRAADRRRMSTGSERGRREGGSERGGGERHSTERRTTVRRPAERPMGERERPPGERERPPGERGQVPGRRPIVEIEPPMIVSIPTLQEQLDNPAGILEVWFHDTRLAKGMTYSYRFRMVLVNPLLGRSRDVENKADAKVQTLKTPWSDWSESVLVKRPTEFFLVGSASLNKMVVVEVFTQRWGQRVSHRFTLGAGEPIGADISKELLQLGAGEPVSTVVSFKTGAIAVSFDFKKKQRIPGTDFSRTTTELLYLDTDGVLRTRTQFADDSSPRYKELLNEVRQASGTIAGVR